MMTCFVKSLFFYLLASECGFLPFLPLFSSSTPRFLHETILPPRIVICNYTMRFPLRFWKIFVIYLWWELRWPGAFGCVLKALLPIIPKHQINPRLAQLGHCQCLQGHIGSTSSSLPTTGLKRALLSGQSKLSWLPQKKVSSSVWFFLKLFFKVDFSSTGALLGWESETELDVAGRLRWARRAPNGEVSWETCGIPSFWSHLVDQSIAQW